MLNFKKFFLLLFSVLLCTSTYGCSFKLSTTNNQSSSEATSSQSSSNSTQSNNDLFQVAIEKFYCSTSYHESLNLESTNPSIFGSTLRFDESSGYYPKSIKIDTDYNFEIKKDSDIQKRIKYSASQIVSYTNGKTVPINFYYQNDGFEYKNLDGQKTKEKDYTGPAETFLSVEKDIYNNNNLESLDLKTENSQKIFDFKIKPNNITNGYNSLISTSSNISVTSFSGSIVTDENNNIIKFTINTEYKDSSNNATAKEITEYTNINNTTINPPSDLASYK